MNLEWILEGFLAGLLRAGFTPGKAGKAVRRGRKAGRDRTLDVFLAFRAFLASCPEARACLDFADGPDSQRDDVRARGQPLSPRGPEIAPEEVMRQVGRTADFVAGDGGGPSPVRVWHGDQWVPCLVRSVVTGPGRTILFELLGRPEKTAVWADLDAVHPADRGQVFLSAGETGEVGPDWLKMRGGSDGSGQQDDPPEGPATAG